VCAQLADPRAARVVESDAPQRAHRGVADAEVLVGEEVDDRVACGGDLASSVAQELERSEADAQRVVVEELDQVGELDAGQPAECVVLLLRGRLPLLGVAVPRRSEDAVAIQPRQPTHSHGILDGRTGTQQLGAVEPPCKCCEIVGSFRRGRVFEHVTQRRYAKPAGLVVGDGGRIDVWLARSEGAWIAERCDVQIDPCVQRPRWLLVLSRSFEKRRRCRCRRRSDGPQRDRGEEANGPVFVCERIDER